MMVGTGAEPSLLSGPHGHARTTRWCSRPGTSWCLARGADQLFGETRGDSRFRRAGWRRADGADADDLRRHAGSSAATMTLGGVPFAPATPRDAIDAGMFLVPEDRKRHGLVLPMSVAENTTLPNVGTTRALGHARPRGRAADRRDAGGAPAHQDARRCCTRWWDCRVATSRRSCSPSGSRMNPRVLILDEPTRGIDVAAKAEIYQEIAALAERGIAILLVSSELEEVIGLCDRVVVLREGRISGIVTRERLTQEYVGALMTGQAEGGPSHAA